MEWELFWYVINLITVYCCSLVGPKSGDYIEEYEGNPTNSGAPEFTSSS